MEPCTRIQLYLKQRFQVVGIASAVKHLGFEFESWLPYVTYLTSLCSILKLSAQSTYPLCGTIMETVNLLIALLF